MNTVQLIGRLTKDVDLRYTAQGTAVGNFTLAVNRTYTNQSGEREADFINCVIWRKAAENLANFTRKGSLIGVDGRIQTRNYENQQGQRVYVTEVVVNNFYLLESRSVTERRADDNQASGSYNQNQGQSYSYDNFNSGYQGQGFNQGQNNYSQDNYSQDNFSSGYQADSSPYLDDGNPVDISEDDLPF